MAWVAVDMFGCERVYEQKPRRFVNCVWVPTRCSYADRLNDFVTIPNGSIEKLIKRCINEMSSVLLDNLYGYWRGDLSDYLKDRSNLEYSMRGYKNDAYRYVMEWLDKKK